MKSSKELLKEREKDNKLWRIFLSFLIPIILVGTTGVAILYSQGYRIDTKSGKVKQTGVVSLTSDPKGAIFLFRKQKYKLPEVITGVDLGKYQASVWRNKYVPINFSIDVQSGFTYVGSIKLFYQEIYQSMDTILEDIDQIWYPQTTGKWIIIKRKVCDETYSCSDFDLYRCNTEANWLNSLKCTKFWSTKDILYTKDDLSYNLQPSSIKLNIAYDNSRIIANASFISEDQKKQKDLTFIIYVGEEENNFTVIDSMPIYEDMKWSYNSDYMLLFKNNDIYVFNTQKHITILFPYSQKQHAYTKDGIIYVNDNNISLWKWNGEVKTIIENDTLTIENRNPDNKHQVLYFNTQKIQKMYDSSIPNIIFLLYDNMLIALDTSNFTFYKLAKPQDPNSCKILLTATNENIITYTCDKNLYYFLIDVDPWEYWIPSGAIDITQLLDINDLNDFYTYNDNDSGILWVSVPHKESYAIYVIYTKLTHAIQVTTDVNTIFLVTHDKYILVDRNKNNNNSYLSITIR